MGPARLAHKHGLRHETLTLAIASALCYDNPGDAQARELQKRIADEGLDNLLTITCGLLPHEPLSHDIKRHWAEIHSTRKKSARGVHKIIAEVETELTRNHDARKVKEAMLSVANEYQSARILSYLPILLKRKVQSVLSHMKI